MIRFVDLSESYWPDESHGPVCAFLDTVTDRFVEGGDGDHVFTSIEDVKEHLGAERLLRVVPSGFFARM